MEKFIESIYGVITFYVVVTILSFAVAIKVKQNQELVDANKATYVATNYAASYTL